MITARPVNEFNPNAAGTYYESELQSPFGH